MMTMDNII